MENKGSKLLRILGTPILAGAGLLGMFSLTSCNHVKDVEIVEHKPVADTVSFRRTREGFNIEVYDKDEINRAEIRDSNGKSVYAFNEKGKRILYFISNDALQVMGANPNLQYTLFIRDNQGNESEKDLE